MYGVSRWKRRLNDMIPLIKKRVQFEYKEHTEYKGYAINRGYEQRNDMNAHVIVLIEFAMSYCGYMPLTINYAGNSLFMEPYAKQFWLQTCRLKENEHDYKNFVFVPVNNYSIFFAGWIRRVDYRNSTAHYDSSMRDTPNLIFSRPLCYHVINANKGYLTNRKEHIRWDTQSITWFSTARCRARRCLKQSSTGPRRMLTPMSTARTAIFGTSTCITAPWTATGHGMRTRCTRAVRMRKTPSGEWTRASMMTMPCYSMMSIHWNRPPWWRTSSAGRMRRWWSAKRSSQIRILGLAGKASMSPARIAVPSWTSNVCARWAHASARCAGMTCALKPFSIASRRMMRRSGSCAASMPRRWRSSRARPLWSGLWKWKSTAEPFYVYRWWMGTWNGMVPTTFLLSLWFDTENADRQVQSVGSSCNKAGKPA